MSVSGEVVSAVQSHLRLHFSSLNSHNLVGFDQERSQLYNLIRRTAQHGESNSLLIIGPRGGGKTTLLRSVLSELSSEADVNNNLLQVHLNGLLQTDDRLVLNEITRQLELDNCSQDKVFGSFSENLQFLLESLKIGGKESKSVLFVLEEFDMFTQHRNQTILYNLFDVSQSAQTPVCVLGLTVRLDVLELLEKRVKSRFSHRFLHLLPTYGFSEYKDICRSSLKLPANFQHKDFMRKWNKSIEALMKEPEVIKLLRQQFTLTKSIRTLHQLLMLAVCGLSVDSPFITVSALSSSYKLLHTDAKTSMLQGVSILELTLVLAMNHLTHTYDGAPFNFEMIYNVYKKFCNKTSTQAFDKAVVMKSFEHLCSLELIQPAEGGRGCVQKEYRPMHLMADESQITNVLQHYPACPSELQQWSTSNLLS